MSDITTKDIVTEIARVTPELSMEECVKIKCRLDGLKERLRDLSAQLDKQLIEWIQVNKRNIEFGQIYWYVGNPPRTVCVDLPGAIEGLLQACGGDLQQLINHLSAQPLKHGACKSTLPADVYERCFVTERPDRLIDGVFNPKLCKGDNRFIEQAGTK